MTESVESRFFPLPPKSCYHERHERFLWIRRLESGPNLERFAISVFQKSPKSWLEKCPFYSSYFRKFVFTTLFQLYNACASRYRFEKMVILMSVVFFALSTHPVTIFARDGGCDALSRNPRGLAERSVPIYLLCFLERKKKMKTTLKLDRWDGSTVYGFP